MLYKTILYFSKYTVLHVPVDPEPCLSGRGSRPRSPGQPQRAPTCRCMRPRYPRDKADINSEVLTQSSKSRKLEFGGKKTSLTLGSQRGYWSILQEATEVPTHRFLCYSLRCPNAFPKVRHVWERSAAACTAPKQKANTPKS